MNLSRRTLSLSLGLVGVLAILRFSSKPSTLEPRLELTESQDLRPVASSIPLISSPTPVPEVRRTAAERLVPEAIESFRDWTRHPAPTAPADRQAWVDEGVRRAAARLRLMADLVQFDPARAFAYEVPYEVRKTLPPEIETLLEKPVTGVGDLAVLGVMPEPGSSSPLPPVLRTVTLQGEEYQAFTYGQGNRFVTKSDVPLYGLSVPNDAASVPFTTPLGQPARLMALNESPIRQVSPAEQNDIVAQRSATSEPDPLCGVSQKPATEKKDEQIVDLGGTLHSFCGKVDLELWRKARIAALGLDVPTAGLASLDTATSPFTEGRKRMLLMRPVWSDYKGGMTTNDALSHWQNFSNYMYEMSYGKLVLAALGKGSDITPTLLLPGLVAEYDNTGLGKLYTSCQDVAKATHGYDLTQYDFLYVCTDGKPAASYCGLAFVGGVGFHLANKCWDAAVSSHEFGHNLGLNHAHFWDTGSKSVIGDGQNVEYGDSNDPLGGGGSPNQYNSRYKNFLGWIKDSDIVDLNSTGSGSYRLYAFDLNEGNGVRGLKIRRKDGTLNYWLNFRQRKTDKKALMNGVQLLWTGNGNEGSYLLDTRLKGNADNNAITIGKTFSDPSISFHVTPVGKGNTYPESIDLVVQIGNVASNLPPVAVVTASTLTPGVGQTVTFTASATDPNGDRLAYSWEFGDGDFSVDNQPVTAHTFSTVGDYAAQCTVSDMKGGTSRHTVILRVGAPTTFRVSGRVFDTQNRPLAGIKVTADATHVAYSDSDGTYTLVGLAAGSYSLNALEPLAGSLTFVHPYFDNPRTIGSDVEQADFVGVTGSLTLQTAFISKKATAWKYLDNGVNQGTGWVEPTFDDRSWKSGGAILGYGQGGETTKISFGNDANNKYPTAYFRKPFVVTDPLGFTNYILEVMRDDGVVVYLNGTEVYRNNMPAGEVTYSTFASDTVEPDSYLATSIAPSEILKGTNWIAAEVHQSTGSSSDLTFDLAFSGISSSNVAGLNLVYLDQPIPSSTLVTPTNLTLRAQVFPSSSASEVGFYADGLKLGSSTTAPFEFVWASPVSGVHQLSCVASLGTLSVTSPPVEVRIVDPTPGLITQDALPSGSNWRYWSKSSAAPTGWNQPTFNDTGWSNGLAKLGFGHGDETTVINGGTSASRYPTVYFRQGFYLQDPAAVARATVWLKRDDGAVVYLNGTELFRDNLPSTAISFSTLATSAADNGVANQYHPLSAAGRALLVPGLNVVAVEVHQSSTTSSDLAFDLTFTTEGTAERSRGCWVMSPQSGELSATDKLELAAEAVAGGKLGIAKVEWFADGVKIGEDLSSPFTTSWQNPTPGSHRLTAIATDSSGAQIPSEPVVIQLGARIGGLSLISFGDVWSYLDDGSDQGTAWMKPTFDDRSWKTGPARFGSSLAGAVTTLNIGTNTAHRNITAYFRRTIVVANPSAIQQLLLSLIRNDGAAVYLNGTEIWRDNLPDRRISYNTLAVEKVTGAGDKPARTALISASGLVAGTNVIAVELHQQSPSNTDASFDLAITGLQPSVSSSDLVLISPGEAAHFNLPATISFSAESSVAASISKVEYFANDQKVAESSVYPYAALWSSASAGSYTLIARATTLTGVVQSPAQRISVGAAPAPITPILDKLITAGSAWRYWDEATPAEEAWLQPEFDDAAWKTGLARLGFGLDGEATTLTSGRVTYYFRRSFNVSRPAAYQSLICSLIRDDGAVVYLNGHELYRSNMPVGAIRPTTTASSAVNTPEETTFFETVIPLTGSGLLEGTNVIAVEVHQQAANSSDAAFDFQLLGIGTTERRITLVSPSLGGFVQAGTGAELTALLQSEADAVAEVEFFGDAVRLGSVAASPWVLTWQDATLGTHEVTARVHFTDGSYLDSAALKVVVSPALVTARVIAPDALWKYNDKGQNLGTSWRDKSFGDSSWAVGAARLGYGDDGETTVVGFGPNAASKYITTYFRNTFVVGNDLTLTNLAFRFQRDDGMAVFLNGKELFRNNLPANALYNTLASSQVNAADEQNWFTTNLVVAALPVGTNVIAVEIHQASADSSDLGFALELNAVGYSKTTPIPRPKLEALILPSGWVQLSWPASATGYRLYAASSLDLPLTSWTLASLAVTTENGRNVVTVDPAAVLQFYRLSNGN